MAEPRKPKAQPRVTFTTDPEGVLDATWETHTIRFLLSDGSTVDVRTARDDSDLRSALLLHFKVERIEGSTRLDPD